MPQAKELIKKRVYRTTPFKEITTCYLEFSHFDDSRFPYFKFVSGVCDFNTDGSYVVLSREVKLYELDQNEIIS